MNVSKHIIASAIVGVLSAPAGSLAAEGFAPWQSARISDTPDADQATVMVKPWGVERGAWQDGRKRTDRIDERQVGVTIRPWYSGGVI